MECCALVDKFLLGQPDGLVICHLPYGPSAYFSLSNTVMRHDIPKVGPVQEVYPHLIFNNFTTPLGKNWTAKYNIRIFQMSVFLNKRCVLK